MMISAHGQVGVRRRLEELSNPRVNSTHMKVYFSARIFRAGSVKAVGREKDEYEKGQKEVGGSGEHIRGTKGSEVEVAPGRREYGM